MEITHIYHIVFLEFQILSEFLYLFVNLSFPIFILWVVKHQEKKAHVWWDSDLRIHLVLTNNIHRVVAG